MNSFSYHSYNDESYDAYNCCNRKSERLPIEINCTGLMNLAHPFTTYNERGREDYYLMYIVEGELLFALDGEDAIGKAGDFIIFPPGYKYKYTFSGIGVISYYFAHFTGSYVNELLSSLGTPELPKVCRAGSQKAVHDAFTAIFDAFAREDIYVSQKGAAYLQAALAAVLSPVEEGGKRERLKKSLSYINAFYTKDITLAELAAMDNLSVSRYNALFREVTGASPVRYICALRINHACSLLETTDMGVGVIGESVGYADKHFFSKMFKKHVGVSPQKYRSGKQ